jgi:signal peptidase I
MKKKIIISGAVFCSLLTIFWVISRFTGMLLFYSIPTISNLPNLKPGDIFYSSNLKDPVPYTFIIYTSKIADSMSMNEMTDSKTESKYIHRLCGIPGNIIEMKNGIFYVADENFDKKINLNNQYKISSTELNSIEQPALETMYETGAVQMTNKDSALIIFDSVMIKKYAFKIKLVQYLQPISDNGPFTWNNKDRNWTADNFGPLKIPHDCYFVLGDNRHNALDSRYTGFVKKANIKGVVLNK